VVGGGWWPVVGGSLDEWCRPRFSLLYWVCLDVACLQCALQLGWVLLHERHLPSPVKESMELRR